MIKIDYKFKALSPIHTGSDKSTGTVKTLRRQKIMIPEKEIEVNFDEESRRIIIVEILYSIYRKIDKTSMNNSRLLRIWEEMHNKIAYAATVQNRFQFFSTLCEIWGVCVHDLDILELLENISDVELLQTIRDELNYIVLKLRQKTQKEKENKKNKIEPSKFVLKGIKKQKNVYKKTFEWIPMIIGNSIRGALRDLVMIDFVRRCGIESIFKTNYHILFTGGALNDNSLYEDIERREELIRMCPPLGVLGSAIGNMTIEGQLGVSHALPLCSELGNGGKSFWEYLDIIFQTRNDKSKKEKRMEIVEREGGESETHQMKYEYEVFAKGTEFQHGFRVHDFDELSVSCFWHMMNLFKERPIICGMWSVGNSELDLSELEIKEGANKLYLDYLKENKIQIKEFFEGLG